MMARVRVVHLNHSDADTSGGFARSAYQLHRGLLELGVDSSLLVGRKYTHAPEVAAFRPGGSLSARVRRRMLRHRHEHLLDPYARTRPRGLDLFSDDRAADGPELLRQIPDCDIITLHWVKGLVDYRTFFGKMMPRQPIVWRFSDMNVFTGGCHYDGGCGRFREQCGVCPQLGSGREDDLSGAIWARKKRIFDRVQEDRLHIVSQSEWLAGEVRRSSILDRFPVTVIPNGVDASVFRLLEKAACRSVLGVPADARVVLFVAGSVENQRKGFGYLAEALRSLALSGGVDRLWFLSVGRGEPRFDVDIPHLHLGPVANDRFLAAAYNAADTYVITSLQDNLPNTVLEAMACGVPVVGFDTGGIPDMVARDRTGRLVPVGDSNRLSDAIAGLLLDDSLRWRLARNCREAVVREFTRQTSAERFAALYDRLLSAR